ncbi:hypothetical protein ABZ379_43405 [Streptomyces canus]
MFSDDPADWIEYEKTRWNLTADDAELAALNQAAQTCPERTVTYELAP